jgi:hypothetical protein
MLLNLMEEGSASTGRYAVCVNGRNSLIPVISTISSPGDRVQTATEEVFSSTFAGAAAALVGPHAMIAKQTAMN